MKQPAHVAHTLGMQLDRGLGRVSVPGLDSWTHPTKRARHHGTPERVALVCLGPTRDEYTRLCLTKGEQRADFDEVWTVNRGLRVYRADLGFVMDDLYGERKGDQPYGDFLSGADLPPFLTSTHDQALASWPCAYTFPLAHLAYMVGQAGMYLHNSVPIALAYALMIGVAELTLFGADYTFQGSPIREDDRANCEFWVGWCRSAGMRVGVPATSSLLNLQKHGGGAHFYGYDSQHRASEQAAEGLQLRQTHAEQLQAGEPLYGQIIDGVHPDEDAATLLHTAREGS